MIVAALATSLAAPALVRADAVSGARHDLVERAHTVDVRADRGVATLTVRRTLQNKGPTSDEATLSLTSPPSSVATRLRAAGTNASGRTFWFEGELKAAEQAAATYRELTGVGDAAPRTSALLSWDAPDELTLRVFPVPARGTKTVEYTLLVPLAYERGAYRAELPAMGTAERAPTVRISAARPGDGAALEDDEGRAHRALRADAPLSITLRPRNAPTLDGSLASVAFGEGMHLVRSSIVAAPRLAALPRGAHVVVLFDASRSHRDAPSALAAVRSYLASMPAATVDFLTFDREVRAPIGRALPVATARARLGTLSLTLRNGSHVDLALARADAILRGSAARTRRVLVVTDTLTRSAVTADSIGATPWRSGAVLHVASVRPGAPATWRDDDAPWAALPRRTGGLFWRARASVLSADARAAFEEWARPKRVGRLTVSGLDASLAIPDELEEGEGFEHFAVATSAAHRVEVSGELWSKPVSTTLTPAAEQSRLAAALAFGSDGPWTQLSEEEQRALAMRGRAVSPVTSYLAVEPGARPSTEGLDDAGESARSRGSSLSMRGSATRSATAPPKPARAAFGRAGWLREAVAAVAKRCTGGAGDVSVRVESTLDEIVDVRDVVLTPSGDQRTLACVREGVWGVLLPDAFDQAFEAHAVTTPF